VLSIVIATTVAEQVGFISYAPLMASGPVVDGHLAASWLTSYAGATAVVVVVAALFYTAP
jgi:hypothetical protein